jgi:diketogulonate reductase-like aldo/keto reductase
LEELIDKGIINCMGVSNFDVNLLEKAISAAKKYEIAANEIEYNILNKSSEKDIIPFSKKNNIKIIAYSPLAKGEVAYIKQLEEIGKKYNKTPIQVALNYLTRNSIPIPKAANKKHIDEIIGSLGWQLREEDYRFLQNNI